MASTLGVAGNNGRMQQEVATLKIDAVQITTVVRAVRFKTIPGIDCVLPGDIHAIRGKEQCQTKQPGRDRYSQVTDFGRHLREAHAFNRSGYDRKDRIQKFM